MPRDIRYDHTVRRRSDGTRRSLRPPQPWPDSKPFRILSIDGGGIKGLLPCLVLAEIEDRFLNGEPIGNHFDMMTGTSTGGIIVLGLGQGKTAREISRLYLERGSSIFPNGSRVTRTLRAIRQLGFYAYDRKVLESELRREFGLERFGSSRVATCIPSFEGRYSEPYVFKTPHHPDYKRDQHETLVDVGLSTAAAPTFFAAVERDGYIFADGGIWANNPVMVGLVDALTCFDIDRRQVRILSLGCGQERNQLGFWQRIGGFVLWSRAFYRSAMKSQSHNALGQAGLLVGRDHLLRLDAPETENPIAMDDVRRACSELPDVARALVDAAGDRINDLFELRTAGQSTKALVQATE